jgi:hypothetical protein
MANERVSGRSSPALLVGVVAAVVVAAALWFVMRDPSAGAGSTAGAPVISPVDDYLAFADGLAASGGSAADDLVVDGLRRLAGALGTLKPGDPELPVDLRVAAEHIIINPGAADTTTAVRTSLVAAALALEGEGSSTTLRGAADAIDSSQPIAEQREALARFFMLAAESVRGARGPAR